MLLQRTCPGRRGLRPGLYPERTALLQRAAAQGCEIVPGVEMFIEQAARQFEIFTGDSAPRAVMQQAAREALAEQFNHLSSHTLGV